MVPQVVQAIIWAIGQGLHLPIVYNTSAYDSLESLRQLEGLIDIYMPDFKLWSSQRGRRYLRAENYGECARGAIAEMHRQVGTVWDGAFAMFPPGLPKWLIPRSTAAAARTRSGGPPNRPSGKAMAA